MDTDPPLVAIGAGDLPDEVFKMIVMLAEVNSVVDTAQIQAVCSFPRIPLTEGLRRTLAWYVAEGRGRSPVKRIPPEQPLQLSR